jgi:hypothetical protein
MNKLETLSAITLAASACGCTTPGDVRSTPPIYEATSSKTAKALAGCVADKFELSLRSGVNSRPTSNGYSIWKEDDMGLYGKITGLVVDIDDAPSGSFIRFYSKGALASAKDTVVRALDECKR